MTYDDLSPLEVAILNIFFSIYGVNGFPSPQNIEVIARNNTGAGRYVYLRSDAKLHCADGYLDMGGKFIEMDGVENGMMAVVSVSNGEIDQLEISTYEGCWDGSEREWKII